MQQDVKSYNEVSSELLTNVQIRYYKDLWRNWSDRQKTQIINSQVLFKNFHMSDKIKKCIYQSLSIKMKSILRNLSTYRKRGYILRNSSVDSTKPNDAKNNEYIKTLLSDGIKWAGTTIVLIGPKTHTRPWIDWEIEKSLKQGNRIIGVFINGATDSDIPENFNKYGDALVGWISEKIIDAIEGN